jgi:dipeptidyl aminopeptidase/acylaminoacyl peptidase
MNQKHGKFFAGVLLATCLSLLLAGCGKNNSSSPGTQSRQKPELIEGDDLAEARKGFVTRLRVRRPAPQQYQDETPPQGVREVTYTSGNLSLKGWLSEAPPDGKPRPAVVFLHGGWAFSGSDWDDAAPFVEAGFVLFMPTLRAENGNPGNYESFFGEVDDAIAAGQYVASLPFVDKENIFVAGHSVGAVLTCLAAMMPSPYRAAAALDGYVDMADWAAHCPGEWVSFDRRDHREVRVRNPMAFAASLRCPLRLYAGNDHRDVNAPLATRAKELGKDCELVVVPGDHHQMVAPAVTHAIAWFREVMASR